MLLFQKRFHAGLLDGTITLTFRAWQKPHVKVGGRYRCHPIGVLEVEAIEAVRVGDITEDDALRAGFADRLALLGYMAPVIAGEVPLRGAPRGKPAAANRGKPALAPRGKPKPAPSAAAPPPADAQVFRIALRWGGDGDRVTVALEETLDEPAREALRKRLARLDALAPHGPWTRATLQAIVTRPRTAARLLAADLGREKLDFKADVIKLKRLGLTQSFEIGYEVSPRGRAFLAGEPAVAPKATARPRGARGAARTGSPSPRGAQPGATKKRATRGRKTPPV
ncbi:MAG: hypothetical protein WKG00_13025 [Polyangiaceae bacterium]